MAKMWHPEYRYAIGRGNGPFGQLGHVFAAKKSERIFQDVGMNKPNSRRQFLNLDHMI